MNLNSLTPAEGSIKQNKRLGRGQGSGRGGTSTRGHKGAQSRAGNSKKLGFEGGQMPLQRRVPKFGFKNRNRVAYKAINLSTIQAFVEAYEVTAVTFDLMREHGLVGKNDLIKILGNGELTTKVDVKAHAFSKSAVEAIEKSGGKTEKIA